MMGGLRLLFVFFFLLVGAVALVHAADSSVPSGPPKAKVAPVEDTVQGRKIVDPYRYLENSSDPDTQQYVERELAYTRSLLDPLPGRDKINARLSQLLPIGTVGVPQMGGKYYFYTRREGNQNQPVLYVRESLNGTDRVLVDVNKMSSDGTGLDPLLSVKVFLSAYSFPMTMRSDSLLPCQRVHGSSIFGLFRAAQIYVLTAISSSVISAAFFAS